MLAHARTLLEIVSILARGRDVGDVAVLKLTFFSEAEAPGIHTPKVLELRQQNFQPLDLDALGQLEAGSFGHAYADFMRRNGLSPFNFSARVHPLFERFPVATRYARVHDMIHVLLGFETDWVGEIAVYAFVAEQHYSDTLDRAARMAHRAGKLLWTRRKQVVAAERRARELASGAQPLVSAPLESMLEQPLPVVRQRLGLPQSPTR